MPTTYYQTMNGRIRNQETGGTRIDYLTDALGSITATVDGTGNIERTYRYKPYGAQLAATGSGTVPGFRWTGDSGSKPGGRPYIEQYNRARHYSPSTANWSTVDSLWPEELPYSYVTANPTSKRDPSGTTSCRDRTKKYCEWYNANHSNHGAACFCFVSGEMCKFIEAPSELLCRALGPPLYEGCMLIMKKCQGWANCINACLFSCFEPGREGCSDEAKSCWNRITDGTQGGCKWSSHPCGRALCNCGHPNVDIDKEQCCRSHVYCEQTQLTHCNSKNGPCGKADKISPPIWLPGIGAIGSCSQLMKEVGKKLGFPEFPFDGGRDDRANEAYRLCCKKKVWAGQINV